jgi:hypothetical protein
MIGMQGCIFKMWRNFTYEGVGQRRRLKAIKKKIVAQKTNVIPFFDREPSKYPFRALHEVSSSWSTFNYTVYIGLNQLLSNTYVEGGIDK